MRHTTYRSDACQFVHEHARPIRYDARVPPQWESVSWLSATLGFWFTELVNRHAQFHSWCFRGRPKAFWMTGFFNATVSPTNI